MLISTAIGDSCSRPGNESSFLRYPVESTRYRKERNYSTGRGRLASAICLTPRGAGNCLIDLFGCDLQVNSMEAFIVYIYVK